MNILVVEDDPVSSMMLKTLLEKLGHTVVSKPDGVQGWDEFQSRPVPVVITDWMMPEMDGIELCRRIRAQKTAGYTCVIMLTAKQGREDRLAAMNAGADVFLSKPLDKDDLIARLQVADRILRMEQKKAA